MQSYAQVIHNNGEPRPFYSYGHKPPLSSNGLTPSFKGFTSSFNGLASPNYVPKHDDHANVGSKLPAILSTWEWSWRDVRVAEDSGQHARGRVAAAATALGYVS